GGETRLSNFLLWQSAYAELYFTKVLWPDFNKKNLDNALNFFNKKVRKFGKIT
ncbi:MAG: undecaprenyl diphosphate synthase family protein, partial [Methylophilaceae bacterium]